MPGFFCNSTTRFDWAFAWSEEDINVIGHGVDHPGRGYVLGSLSEDPELNSLAKGMDAAFLVSRDCTKEEFLGVLSTAMKFYLETPKSTSLVELTRGPEGADLKVSVRQDRTARPVVLEGMRALLPSALERFLEAAFVGTGLSLTLSLEIWDGYEFEGRDLADEIWCLAGEAILSLLTNPNRS